MRHYEIVYLVHPDQEQQMSALVDRYKAMVKDGGGKIHRFENWGRRQLAYPINKLMRAYYLLFNIECDQKVLAEIANYTRFNDSILRELTLQKKEAVTEASPMMRSAGEPPRSRPAERSRSEPPRSQSGDRDRSEPSRSQPIERNRSEPPRSQSGDQDRSDRGQQAAPPVDDKSTPAEDSQ